MEHIPPPFEDEPQEVPSWWLRSLACLNNNPNSNNKRVLHGFELKDAALTMVQVELKEALAVQATDEVLLDKGVDMHA